MTELTRSTAVLTVLGGLIWTPVPFLQATRGSYGFADYVAVVAPLTLLGGVYGLSQAHDDGYGTGGRGSLALLSVGLLGFAAFAASEAFDLGGLPLGLLFSGVGFLGVAAAEAGALALGYVSLQNKASGFSWFLIIALALPINIVLLNSLIRGSVFYFWGGVYGLAWAGIGVYLWQTRAE